MHMPGDGPDVGVEVLPQAGWAYVFSEEGAVDGRKRFERHKEVGSGGEPLGAILGESTARDNGVEVGMILELSAPGVKDTGTTRASVPLKRSSLASRLRASDEALTRAWETRR